MRWRSRNTIFAAPKPRAAASGGELLGKTQWEVYPHTKGTVLDLQYSRALAEGVTVHFENFDPVHDRWYELHGYPSPEGLSVYFRDVSERKRA